VDTIKLGICDVCGGRLVTSRYGTTVCTKCWRARCAECGEIIYKNEDIHRNGRTIHGRCCNGPQPRENNSEDLEKIAKFTPRKGTFGLSARRSAPTESWATVLER